MSGTKQKNRRYRGAKISEHRLKNLVRCFAADLSVKDAAAKTKFSEPTVRDIFMRLRQHLFDYGFMRVDRRDNEGAMPARIVFAKKHRGVPEKFAHLFETEFLHRVYFTKNGRAVKRFAAKNEKDLEAVRKFVNYNKVKPKYEIIEVLGKNAEGKLVTRPFEPADFRSSSIIVINELNLSPNEAFFRYIWALLLKRPL